MAQSLTEIAQTLKDANKKVQLIYAFNGTGKTRLSREFRLLVAPKDVEEEEELEEEETGIKVLYYNAFTEDLFYWDNDLDADLNRKLTIRPNGFTNLALNFLKEQGQDGNIVSNFQHYTSPFITPKFSEDFSEVTFSMERGGDDSLENIKISKGEESNFIWCVFYSLLEEVIGILNIPEPEERSTPAFNNLEYIFIDDPVSSLDDAHLIELAVNIAKQIKSSTSELKFIITTHNPLFYNVLYNEFNRVKKTMKWRLEKMDDGTFSIDEQLSDSPFSYHLFLLSELEKAIQPPVNIQKYHFNFLRNILEKTSTFLGYNKWEELLPQDSRQAYYDRILNLSSHSKHHGEEISIVDENDKRVLGFLVQEIKRMYSFKSTIIPIVTENDTV
ncbi:AAA family ATPase [Flavobacterium salmonis]|jgi:wobble nucleotide-excising tRNase|uniref:Anticodon nuclease n=1 Tax=Flavobacterium salmonis TaxID=2654844 RepID=A0A6V6YN20_9FLAO|nr:AAA family ATPase [Flavobacterium salmonis]CAD0000891.1 anticodon nuclease [Flavobacterium salmonis]